jgi:signal transduction histidine kinase
VPIAGDFLGLVAQLSSRFVHVAADEVEVEVEAALRRVLDFFDLDRGALLRIDPDRNVARVILRLRPSDTPEPMEFGRAGPLRSLYDAVVDRGRMVAIPNPDELPAEAGAEAEILRASGVKSLLLIPLRADGPVEYVLTLGSERQQRHRMLAHSAQLRLLGEVIVTAINRQVLVQERLRSEAALAEAQRIANLGSWQWDIAADRVTTSEQCDRIRGVRVGCLDDFIAAVHPDDRDAVRAQVARDMAAPRAQGRFEYRIQRPDGVVRHVRDLYECVLGEDGNLVRVIGTVQDITEQTLMRQQLHRAQLFARSTLDAFHKCLCVIDVRGTVVEVSDGWPAFARASGSAQLAAGADFFQAIGDAAGPAAAQASKLADGVRAVLGGLQDEFAMESAFDGPGGARYFQSKVTHFELEGATYAAISHEDITQRKTSEIELQNLRNEHWHAERVTRTGLLIASLAHELSQPLTAILSNAQAGLRFLARERPDLKEIADILKDITLDNKRAGEIIESLRVMLRRQQSERQLVDLAVVAGEVTVLLRSELVATQVELECDFTPGCLALVDRAQIQQVLLNLMMNGIEAMNSRPHGQRHLRIGVRPAGQGEVQISVLDSGVGITQEKFKNVFDAFWTTKSRGTGMGLAISRSIVESHGGRIWVDSRNGEGSTFFVLLPAAATASRAADATRAGV